MGSDKSRDKCHSRHVKSDSDRGAFGTWLRAARLAAKPTAYPAAGNLAKALADLRSGVTWNRTKVADFERGKDEPDTAELADIVRLLGQPNLPVSEPPADNAVLIAALERHTVAMTKLADEMRTVYLAQKETVRLLGLTDAQKERLALEGSQSGKPLGSPQPDQPRSRRRTTNGRAGR